MPALPTNLVKVGSTYKYRSRIPKDLLRYYSPKKEVTESLQTKSLVEAKRLLPAVQFKYQQEWTNLRAALSEDVTELPLNDATIQYLTATFEYESLGGDEATRLAQNYTLEEVLEYREQLSEAIEMMRDLAGVGEFDKIKPALEEYLRLKKIKVIGSAKDYDRLALAYLHGAIKTNSALLARMQGEFVPTPVAKTSPTSPPDTHSSARQQGKITLYSLFEYWRDAVQGRPQRTIDDVERRIQQMDALTGNKAADQLTKADFVQFRDAMIAKGKAASTVAKDLSFLKTVMSYAYESDKIPSNPAAGIKVSKPKVSTKIRRKLQQEDIRKLFSSSIYSAQERPLGGGGDAAAWVPLLGLYTGARLEEVCQLRMADLQEQDGIHFFDITDLDDEEGNIKTSVKTDESRRRVPLHAALINAGFLTYAEHARAQGHDWLFPHLQPDRYGRRGGNWSKWWVRWRKSLGVVGASKCFHAFRHTFKSACREAEIKEETHDALTGHSGGGVGRDYGDFPLTPLHRAMQKLRYPGFEFNWVWSPPVELWIERWRSPSTDG